MVDLCFVQWLVASFLTWHSLHGKPVILDGNLALHRYHVTALLVYLIQGNNASLFFIFLYFFQYNLKTTYFQGLRTFGGSSFKNAEAFLLRGCAVILIGICQLCWPESCAKSHGCSTWTDKRKSTTSAHVVLFLFGMSLRGFPRCFAVCIIIYKSGEYPTMRMYI